MRQPNKKLNMALCLCMCCHFTDVTLVYVHKQYLLSGHFTDTWVAFTDKALHRCDPVVCTRTVFSVEACQHWDSWAFTLVCLGTRAI